MVDSQDEAKSCLTAIAQLAGENDKLAWSVVEPRDLAPIRALLNRAQELLDGSAEKRERKNAGDRSRRATRKSPGRPAKKKRPGRPRKVPAPNPEIVV